MDYNSNQDDFVELFVAHSYSGIVDELKQQIEDLLGVTRVSMKSKLHHTVKNRDVTIEIVYNPVETDRTQLCHQIEEFENVDGDVVSA